MQEVWKPIEGTEGKYEVSNTGKVRSNGTHVTRGIRELNPKTDKYGYQTLTIFYNNKKRSRTVHRLVAEAFIPNPDGFPQINHIDGDKTNNAVGNLEWCTVRHNIKHAFDIGLKEKSRLRALQIGIESNKKKSKPIIAMDSNGSAYEFVSISEASRKLNISRANIQQVLKNDSLSSGRKTAGGYTFKYKGGDADA